jgi:hypothetical protein
MVNAEPDRSKDAIRPVCARRCAIMEIMELRTLPHEESCRLRGGRLLCPRKSSVSSLNYRSELPANLGVVQWHRLRMRRLKVNVLSAVLSLPFVFGGTMPVSAYITEVLERTYLLNVTHRWRLYEFVQKLGDGGYELSDGKYVDFRKWYAQRWIDIQFDFMTQLNDDFGLLWGISTGEWGEKYRISPAFKIGLIGQKRFGANHSVSISVTKLFGGKLRERPCTADYGDIGGVQIVNCRLAASVLEPSETLGYLIKLKPRDHTWLGLRYQLRF